MDQFERASSLRRVGTLGLICGVLGCTPQVPTRPDATSGAGRANTQPAAAGADARNVGAITAAGSGGVPLPTGAAGTAGPSSGASGTARSDADTSLIVDASLVDAAHAPDPRDAAPPSQDAKVDGDASMVAPPSSGCAGSTFALCEDFESGALDSKVWKLTQSKGTATLDASRAARGSHYSVHVHVDPGSDTMVGLTESKTFPALKAALFARAFIFIPGAMATALFNGDRHSRLIYAQGATPYGEYALGIWNGGIIQNHYSKTDDSQDTKMLPPFDEWFCLEYELDSAAGNVKAYLNDVEITALRHTGWPASNIDTLMFGVDRYGSFPVAEDIWFDDLVVDSARIGCMR
jgi:hypothetical protein